MKRQVKKLILKERLLHIGNELKRARIAKGWDMKKAASKVELSKSMLSQIENGHNCPSVHSLISCIEVYGIDSNIVLGGTRKTCRTCNGSGTVVQVRRHKKHPIKENSSAGLINHQDEKYECGGPLTSVNLNL